MKLATLDQILDETGFPLVPVQSAGAVEYDKCISAEG